MTFSVIRASPSRRSVWVRTSARESSCKTSPEGTICFADTETRGSEFSDAESYFWNLRPDSSDNYSNSSPVNVKSRNASGKSIPERRFTVRS